jgi:curved DNA-binding protein CbpA
MIKIIKRGFSALNSNCHYEVLKIKKGASMIEVKKAYYVLVK